MKTLLLFFTIFLFSSCDPKTTDSTGQNDASKDPETSMDTSQVHKNLTSSFPFTISDGRIGNIQTGEKLDVAFAKLSSFKIETDSLPTCAGCDTYAPIFNVYDPQSNKLSFTIEPGWEQEDKDQVFRIRVEDERFVTDKGLRVGMKVEAIKQQYDIKRVAAGGEVGIHILVNAFEGSFGIEKPKDEDWWRVDKETIPDSLKIYEIIVL